MITKTLLLFCVVGILFCNGDADAGRLLENQKLTENKLTEKEKIDRLSKNEINPFEVQASTKAVAHALALYITLPQKNPQFKNKLPSYLENEKSDRILEILNVKINYPKGNYKKNLFQIAAMEGDNKFIETILNYFKNSKNFDEQQKTQILSMLKFQRLLQPRNEENAGNAFHISAAQGETDIIQTILTFLQNAKYSKIDIKNYVFDNRYEPLKRDNQFHMNEINVFDFGKPESIETICNFFLNEEEFSSVCSKYWENSKDRSRL